MTPTLTAWQGGGGGGVKATLMTGTPYEKNDKVKPAFCAGGDVKAVYLAGISSSNNESSTSTTVMTADFFREEYKLNYVIATQSPYMPQISIWDGVVMGGGVGLSIHGKYRVATENTVFAMPGKRVYCHENISFKHLLHKMELMTIFFIFTCDDVLSNTQSVKLDYSQM